VIEEHPNHPNLAAFDGVVALFIMTLSFAPFNLVFGGIRHLSTLQLRFIDVAFGSAFIASWHYCFAALDTYNRLATVPSRMLAASKGVCITTVGVIAYLLTFYRSAVTIHSTLVMAATLWLYVTYRIPISGYLLDRLGARDPRRAIIVGSGRRASKAWRGVRTRYYSSIKVLGFVDDRDTSEMPMDVARRYLGSVDDLNDLLLNEVVDVILIAMPMRSCYPLMQRAVHLAEDVGVQVVCLEDIYSTRRHPIDRSQAIFRDLAPQQEHYLKRLLIKRVVDISGAVGGLLLLAPLFLCIAVGVKLSSKGPVFFHQQRCGHRRRYFKMIKFRSMVDNAEHMLPGLELQNEANGPIFKMRADPRVTNFGRFLRKTSLDELPQLWNVLVGDMSLVGPRPMSSRDVSLFHEAPLMRRFSVKPGITGLWQVNGRSNVGFDEWMALDRRYIDRWTLLLDFKILARTLSVVLKRSGAM